ncbi:MULTISPECIES: DUF5640 domain-containing protein [Bacteroides]|uniref:DUF5640 domain-containing protein n=1 Tax=Bacteroides TaxID=816 RepID=UPI00189E6912|nr:MULTISPECIES: DUF5640 domain-containing protein [Bacteroides]MDC2612484.1 DUF5640 domain-containing protein [Bacteroides ovatus]MDC2632020.1 DUF5640 domain-containing protein [Bacteroides ovatus]
MKTLRLIGATLLMVVLCVNFAACGDDDDDEKASIVGTWKAESSDDGYVEYFTFNSDGTGKSWEVSSNGTQGEAEGFTYKVSGNKLTFTWEDGEDYTSTFSLSGNRLTIKDNEDSVTFIKQ